MGLIFRDKGNLDKTLKYHQGALEIGREIGYKNGEASQLGSLQQAYRVIFFYIYILD